MNRTTSIPHIFFACSMAIQPCILGCGGSSSDRTSKEDENVTEQPAPKAETVNVAEQPAPKPESEIKLPDPD